MPQGNPQGYLVPPGLRRRREELDLLQDAADSGSTQARMRLSSARNALGRQQAEYARRVGERLRKRSR